MGLSDNSNLESFLEEVQKLYYSKNSGNAAGADKPQFGGFQVPIKSSYHNSGGFDPTGKGNVGRVHEGIDLRASGGTSIYPIAAGIVTAVRPDPKGGNTVNVKHFGSVTSYYAHMGTIAVHVGDNVDTNTVLGTVGASGNAKGFPHLHIQIWKNGVLIDPATIISVPVYTQYNPKKERLWLPNAKEIAQNWNIQKHISSTKYAGSKYDKLLNMASVYYEIATSQ
jgi:murein DD-endopeptidase MepM/ murein hydrolase activator NlpD